MRKVLDKGFVELIDVMGDDREPARTARISYSDGIERTLEQDLKLSKFLLEHNHMSPFEMVEFKFRIKAPIFVARQIVRHRMVSWNEFSMRYADPSRLSDDEQIEIYMPEKLRRQDTVNKQSSTEADFEYRVIDEYTDVQYDAIETYNELIKAGVAREVARNVLPVSVYTEWIWKIDLRNFWNVLSQRDHEGAQWETRQYAIALSDEATVVVPELMKLWRDSHGH